jgi:hypothetical protein
MKHDDLRPMRTWDRIPALSFVAQDWSPIPLLLGLLFTLGATRPALAAVDDAPSGAGPKRVTVGRSLSPAALIWRRAEPGGDWQAVADNGAVTSEDLLLGLPGAAVEGKSGAIRLTLQGDLGGDSPYPIIETAVVLHDDPAADLDFTLDRGRVDVGNQAKGSGKVKVRCQGETWNLILAPGARAALEVYGHWPRGMPFTKEPKPDHRPLATLIVLALKGEADLKHGGQQYAMTAPPGPALFRWDNVAGPEDTPHRLDKLPAWAEPDKNLPPAAQEKKAALERLRRLAAGKGPRAAIAEFLNSNNPYDRRVAVLGLGALDDLKGLADALDHAQHPDIWENAALALRHWIGRGPGQDLKLFRMLTDEAKIPPGQAETILQLLHSFSDADRAKPETFELLIGYLNHDRLAIRGLAHWHLTRLVPAGKDIQYDPLAPEAERRRAQQAWKKLIPSGQLPPRPKSGGQ